MSLQIPRISSIAARLVVAVGISIAIAGCDKDSTPAYKEPPGVTVTFGGSDLNPDGTLNAAALDSLRKHSGDPVVNVLFLRTRLTDAGLAQLGQFHNIRRVNASSSRITDRGIEALKKEIPEVAVTK